MKKNQYFLVERNKRTEQFHILVRESSLEEIDLYTMKYRNMEELLGGVNDCFIVNQENSKLHIQEVLFQDCKEVIPLANASLQGALENERNMTHPILNIFCKRMKADQDFYNKVVYGKTALYPKFVRYFLDKRFEDSYSVKYMDGCWIQKSYPLLRNVVWSLHHLIDYSNQNEERLCHKDKLLMMTAEHYHPSQPALFDFIDDEAFSKVLEKKDSEVEHGYQKCKRNGRIK